MWFRSFDLFVLEQSCQGEEEEEDWGAGTSPMLPAQPSCPYWISYKYVDQDEDDDDNHDLFVIIVSKTESSIQKSQDGGGVLDLWRRNVTIFNLSAPFEKDRDKKANIYEQW